MPSSWNIETGSNPLAPFAGAADIAVVLGSGFAAAADFARIAHRVSYRDIPSYPETTVAGHPGYLALGSFGARSVLIFAGRSHIYEGSGAAPATAAVELAADLGCGGIILTNAAGGLSGRMRPGALLMPHDVVPFPSRAAARLARCSDRPERAARSSLVSRRLREAVRRAADGAGVPVAEGILAWMPGPSYETAAEARAALALGADAASMSVFPELVAARRRGVACAVLSWITNLAANVSRDGTSHVEVMRRGAEASRSLSAIIGNLPAPIERT